MLKILIARSRGAANPRFLALLCTLLSAATQVGAVEVEDLYRVSVTVAGEDAAQRKSALQEAFRGVLVKVTGSRQVIARQSLQADIADPSRFVQQYRYRALPTQGDVPAANRLLEVAFDADELERLLQQRGLPQWGVNRPGILVWLGLDEQGQKRRLALPEIDLALYRALQEGAATRGLPLLLPLMDLEDQSQLQVADLWGDFENNIRAASRRYGPDLILVGRISALDRELWRGEWRLYQADRASAWNNQAESSSALAADALQRAGDELAALYAPLRQERDLSTVRLQVTGIHSLEDYASVLEILSTQQSLERVVVVSANADTIVYDLHGLGGASALESGLRIGGRLEPDLQSGRGSDPLTTLVDLYYHLR
ncbi:MAG: DUF2066 domain-containing protein [Gammaproteobacteria bacterium]|nr:DUF2066 domain-containing protein [Gammaproteobacteria bacterium]